MSFKVETEIEIKGYVGDKCGLCRCQLGFSTGCLIYKGVRLSAGDANGDVKFWRLAQCLEAEKQYKEKENA